MIGQDHAKKVLAVAVYNHYKRLSKNIPATPANIPSVKAQEMQNSSNNINIHHFGGIQPHGMGQFSQRGMLSRSTYILGYVPNPLDWLIDWTAYLFMCLFSDWLIDWLISVIDLVINR